MKKILVLSHYYPPSSSVGAKRISYIVNFLAKKNHKIIVFKAHNNFYTHTEEEQDIKSKNISIINVSIKNKSRIKSIDWMSFTKEYKKRINIYLQNHKIDLIYIIGGPFSYFPLGKFFYNRYKVPYVLDYRDNFFNFETVTNLKDLFWYLTFKYFWDKPSLKKTKYIINVTPGLTELHRKENKHLNPEKFITILNGYDDKKLSKSSFLDKDKSNKLYKMAIIGKFHYYGVADIDVLMQIIKEYKESKRPIQLTYIGKEEGIFINKAKEFCVSELVYAHKQLPYLEALEEVSNSNLLVLNNNQKYALGTKIFDYIYLNKPILAFVKKDGEIENILNKFENTYFYHKDMDSVKESQSLHEFIQKQINNPEAKLYNDQGKGEKFSRKNQTEKLCRILELN